MGLVAGAGSTAARDVLGAGTGRVVRVAPAAVTVALPGARLVVLDLAPGPASLPCAVLVPALTEVVAAGEVRVGDEVRLDAVGLHLPGCSVRLSRWWAPARVRPQGHRPSPTPPSLLSPVPALGAGALDAVTWRALRSAVAAFGQADTRAAADELAAVLGRGPGSTPAADDAVAGVLLAARCRLGAADAALVDQVGRTVAALAPGRTTPLSAELLRHAAEGLATRLVVQAVHDPTDAARAAVRALGASSGAATLAGIDLVAAARWGRLAA